MFDRLTLGVLVGILGRGQGTEGKSIKGVIGVFVQIAEEGFAICVSRGIAQQQIHRSGQQLADAAPVAPIEVGARLLVLDWIVLGYAPAT